MKIAPPPNIPEANDALAGTRMISWHHLLGWLSLGDRVRLVAICDSDLGKATKRAAKISIREVYSDAEAMLAMEATDAPDVVSPRDTRS